MTVYLLTALAVAILGAALARLRRPPHCHAPPAWVIATGAALVGLAWPLLAAWSVFYFGSRAVFRLLSWVAGEHNKAPRPRIDIRA